MGCWLAGASAAVAGAVGEPAVVAVEFRSAVVDGDDVVDGACEAVVGGELLVDPLAAEPAVGFFGEDLLLDAGPGAAFSAFSGGCVHWSSTLREGHVDRITR